MEKAAEIAKYFTVEGTLEKVKSLNAGHINSTYKLTYISPDGKKDPYVFQRINTSIFKKPEELMENIDLVTNHIRESVANEGGDTSRCTLKFIPAKDGKLFAIDDEGGYWRAYHFVDNCVAYDKVEKPEDFRNAGVALGIFQKRLSDFPADKLHETIVNFHNTVSRINDFKAFVAKNASGRASQCQKEIDFVLEREQYCSVVLDEIAKGTVPLRVTHNDTKLNNVLMDDKTGEVLCLIDLDTVMPGSALYDFGDSIRFGASSADEDEPDLSKVHFVPELYEAYYDGYMSEAADILTEKEKELLPFSCILMTLECGMRFLGDHIDGDNYFSIHRENQNLDRARTQFKLVADMEKWIVTSGSRLYRPYLR